MSTKIFLKGGGHMPTKYPVILVHGIAAKQSWIMNAFGKIGDELEAAGHDVYIADNDGFGRIATNAEQLRVFIENVLEKTGKDAVNHKIQNNGSAQHIKIIHNGSFLLLYYSFFPQYPSYHVSVGVPVTMDGSAFMV